MSAFPGVSSYQSSSLGSKFVVIGVVCCQEMRRYALFHKVLPVLTKYLAENLNGLVQPAILIFVEQLHIGLDERRLLQWGPTICSTTVSLISGSIV